MVALILAVFAYLENQEPIIPSKVIIDYQSYGLSEFPAEEEAKVEGKANITNTGYLNVSLFNGSSWTIKKVQVAITVVKANGEKTGERIYDLSQGYNSNDGAPYKTTQYGTNLGYSLGPGENFTWHIKSLMGSSK